MNTERGPGEGRPARRVTQSSGAGKFAILLVFVLLAGALGFYLATAKKVVEAEPEAVPASPFEGLPPEPPPEKQAKTKGELQREQQRQQSQPDGQR